MPLLLVCFSLAVAGKVTRLTWSPACNCGFHRLASLVFQATELVALSLVEAKEWVLGGSWLAA